MVRTWFKETGEFLDISQEQFAESFCDEFVSVHYPNLREMTIWDLLETWPVEFSYANGMKFVTYFGDIDLVGRDYYDFYWNDSGLIFPVNSNWETLLNVTNTPRLWNYCAKVAAIDAEIRAQALEIGEAIAIFADAVARLAKDSQPDIPDVP